MSAVSVPWTTALPAYSGFASSVASLVKAVRSGTAVSIWLTSANDTIAPVVGSTSSRVSAETRYLIGTVAVNIDCTA